MEHWVRKWLSSIIGDRSKDLDMSPIIERVVKAITDSGLWLRHEIAKNAGEYAWSLNPANLLVSREVSNHACQTCGHQVTSSAVAGEWWNAVPCLRHKCLGHYLPSSASDMPGGRRNGGAMSRRSIPQSPSKPRIRDIGEGDAHAPYRNLTFSASRYSWPTNTVPLISRVRIPCSLRVTTLMMEFTGMVTSLPPGSNRLSGAIDVTVVGNCRPSRDLRSRGSGAGSFVLKGSCEASDCPSLASSAFGVSVFSGT